MFDRNVPNLWTWSRIPPRGGALCEVVAMKTFLEEGRTMPATLTWRDRHPSVIPVTIFECLYISAQNATSRPFTNMFTDRST
jgi:hypothetical protein